MRKTLLVFALIYAFATGGVWLFFQQSALGRADFTFVSGAEPKSLDPAIMTGQLEGRFASAMYEGLTYEDPATMQPAPGVAERWDVSPDGRTWTFYLRDNAVWSNGDPVTAHDFHWSWRRALAPLTASEYSYMLWDLVNAEKFTKGEIEDFSQVGVEVVDDRTLRVRLTAAVPYFLYLTSFYTLFPVHRATVERFDNDPDEAPGAWTKPEHVVTNGPFLFESWVPNDRIRMRKNPKYWNADSIRLDTIDALSIEDTTAALNAFLKGEADWNPSNWPSSLNPEIRKLPTFRTSSAFITYYYRFNTKRKHFADRRVRRAFCMAIDRVEICKNITALGETSAHTLVPPGIPGYTPPPGAQYDPAKARALLAEAGYPGGKGFPEVELLYNTNESHKAVALVLARQLEVNLGVTVRPYNQEWQSYQADTRSMKYDLARAGWIGDYLDPNTFLDMWITDGGNNQTGYSSALYDRLYRIGKDIPAFIAEEIDDAFYGKLVEGDEMKRRVEAARAVPKNEVATLLARCAHVRMLVFKEMERLISEIDCPIMPIYFYVTKNLVKDRIGGFYSQVGPAGAKVDNVRDVHPLRGFFVKDGAE